MVGKKGFIRTIEATIAVLLIFGFIVVAEPKFSKQAERKTPDIIKETQEFMFSEIVHNENYRECISQGVNGQITGSCRDVCGSDLDDFLSQNMPFGYEYACEVCTTAVSCLQDNLPIDRSVYANSIFVAEKNSKIVRIYFWES